MNHDALVYHAVRVLNVPPPARSIYDDWRVNSSRINDWCDEDADNDDDDGDDGAVDATIRRVTTNDDDAVAACQHVGACDNASRRIVECDGLWCAWYDRYDMMNEWMNDQYEQWEEHGVQ